MNSGLGRPASTTQLDNLRLLREQLALNKQQETLGHMKRKDFTQLSQRMQIEEAKTVMVKRNRKNKEQIEERRTAQQLRLQAKLKRLSDAEINRREAMERDELEKIR